MHNERKSLASKRATRATHFLLLYYYFPPITYSQQVAAVAVFTTPMPQNLRTSYKRQLTLQCIHDDILFSHAYIASGKMRCARCSFFRKSQYVVKKNNSCSCPCVVFQWRILIRNLNYIK